MSELVIRIGEDEKVMIEETENGEIYPYGRPDAVHQPER